MSAISRRAARKGGNSLVPSNKARAVRAAAALATQKTGTRSRFHANAEATRTKPARMPAVTVGGNTLNFKVSSQSMGARISAEAPA